MELRHLRYFVAVAESGSITKAAQRLGIQQPPLGQQIRALEAELKVQLFERAPKRIVLSNAGREFLNDARQILQSAKEAMEKVRRFDRGEQGLLTVGFTSSASMHPIAPRILGAFNNAYPLAKVEVEERETYELILRLQQRELDAGFMRFAPRDLPGLTRAVLVDEEMVLAIPRDHALAHKPKQPVTLKMLNGEGFVLYRRRDGVGIYDWLIASLAKGGFMPRVTHEVHRMMASINLVAAGAGLSFVPASMQTLHQEAVVYRPLAANMLPRLPLYLVHRTDQDLMLVKNFIRVAMTVPPKVAKKNVTAR
ncbi:LysR family transcriptional regulator [Pseudorhodoplanes sinuspersici]|uniref:LysR family transcriptional regulator n=1 Tax=Pseudorhodoplanes sinuspersici TaxID=1235591 RepID=A0A1W6ZRU2_9HYPH|nr:LysR family transcriptional regulator [Pseudorhodoplanes sinuspersici]ARQ00072.1 LysR family transcriptional regulator [Pseudorhodoplanes sinuspersici]RKE71114.1 LysR family transcriptional regulator [Pseudorhodoplanes sinuspersici]